MEKAFGGSPNIYTNNKSDLITINQETTKQLLSNSNTNSYPALDNQRYSSGNKFEAPTNLLYQQNKARQQRS